MNKTLESAWESVAKKAQEVDAQLGVSRKSRQVTEDFLRTWPSTKLQIRDFFQSPLGKVTMIAVIYLALQSGFFWSLLSWAVILSFVAPPLAYLAMAYTMKNAADQTQTAGPSAGPFNAPRGTAGPRARAQGGISPDMVAELLNEFRRQQQGGGGGGAAGPRKTSSVRRYEDDGPVIEAQFTEVKKKK